jgi:hypothetical protein
MWKEREESEKRWHFSFLLLLRLKKMATVCLPFEKKEYISKQLIKVGRIKP